VGFFFVWFTEISNVQHGISKEEGQSWRVGDSGFGDWEFLVDHWKFFFFRSE
jgi:hypothetical protein